MELTDWLQRAKISHIHVNQRAFTSEDALNNRGQNDLLCNKRSLALPHRHSTLALGPLYKWP